MSLDLAPPPTGVPYHRLARTSRYFWWRPLLEIVLALVMTAVLLLVVGIAFAMAGAFGDLELESDFELKGVSGLLLMTLALAGLWPASWLAALLAGNRRPAALTSVAGHIRWGWLGKCVLIAIVLWPLVLVVFGLLSPDSPSSTPDRWVGWDELLPLAAVILLTVPIQATAEEYFFRGTLLQAIGAWTPRPWVAIAFTGVCFGLAHGLEMHAFVTLTVYGAVCGWLAIRTGGLEAPIALHVVNNVFAFLASAATGGADSWLADINTNITWTQALLDSGLVILYGAIIARLYRRRELVRASP